MARIGYWASQVNVFWTLDVRCGGDTERSRANKIACCYRITLCVVQNHPDWHPNRICIGTRRKDGCTCCLRVLIRDKATIRPASPRV